MRDGAAGLAPSYGVLLPLAVVAGLGNSVFHPADLSILSHRVTDRMLGRAFAAHGSWARSAMRRRRFWSATIAALSGWRVALVAIGIGGLAVALFLHANRALLRYDHVPRRAARRPRRRRRAAISRP